MEETAQLPINNPVLSLEVYVQPSSNKSQEMWVKRNLRFDGTLLVCLEEKKVHPISQMEMSPTVDSFKEAFSTANEASSPTLPPRKDDSSTSNLKNIKHLRTCLVATPENWTSYITSSETQKNEGKSGVPIKYFKLPQWTIHISEMAGIYAQPSALLKPSSSSTLPYAFIVKTKAGEEYKIKTQSISEWSTWTFVLQMAHSSYMHSRNTPKEPLYNSPDSLKKSEIFLAPHSRPSSTNSGVSLPSPKFTPFHAEDIAQACFSNPPSADVASSLAERRKMKVMSLDISLIEMPLPLKLPAFTPIPPSRKESTYPPIRLLSPELLN